VDFPTILSESRKYSLGLTIAIEKFGNETTKEVVVRTSLERYSRDRKAVAAKLNRFSAGAAASPEAILGTPLRIL